jgi:hypothetical protein
VRSVAAQQHIDIKEETGRLCILWPHKASYERLKAPMIFEQRTGRHPVDPRVTVGTVELVAVLDDEVDPTLALDPVSHDRDRERAKSAILVLLSRGPMIADELEGAVVMSSGTSLQTFAWARRELGEEGTIERFQAPRSDGSSSLSRRCCWWRIAVPERGPAG